MNVRRAQVLIVLAALAASGIGPFQRDIWLLETAPVLLGGGAIVLCWRRFPWTPLASWLVVVFALILCWGGHHSYAQVPLGEWARQAFDLSRNHYDRLGHVFQGVTPAILVRELLRRRVGLRPGAALFWIVAAVSLAVSASYELVEWWTALLVDPEAGAAFLGSQGDPWDAQWDMALALGGALAVQLLFGRLHERQLARLVAP
jgi:putative membrane protein